MVPGTQWGWYMEMTALHWRGGNLVPGTVVGVTGNASEAVRREEIWCQAPCGA